MKNLQRNPVIKLAAVLLLIALTFGAALNGIRFLSAVPYLNRDSFQDTSRFYGLLERKQGDISSAVAYYLWLQGDDMTYPNRQQTKERLDELVESLAVENTWFRFRLMSADGTDELYTNLKDYESLAGTVETVQYATFTPGEFYVDSYWEGGFAAHTPVPEADIKGSWIPDTLVIECGVPSADYMAKSRENLKTLMDGEASALLDEFEVLSLEYHEAVTYANDWLSAAGILAVLALACLLFLLWTAGHKAGEEKPVPSWQDRMFLEVHMAALVGLGLLMIGGLVEVANFYATYQHSGVIYTDVEHGLMLWGGAALATGVAAAAALVLRTLTVRLKTATLVHSTLVLRLILWLWRGGKAFVTTIPLTWKLLLLSAVYLVVTLMFYVDGRYNSFWCFLWFLCSAAAVAYLSWWVVSFQQLRRGSRAIAAGDLDHRVETRKMPPDLKRHGEELNNISAGLHNAVDERMKSERFKAELITNVSHDLKTPLTSIINYVDLLKTTQQTDPKAEEYIAVLDRKSQRLKKLTEDLVEASKASTGMLNISREKISLPQLLDQALGEWSEKLAARNLTLVTSLPEGEVWVFADGRHLWRVVDNLLSNCAKYALEGTRVYLDLARGKGQVTLSVKNISREALNVPPERLMERFVRGEESRTTEGSGLGLSIARSLTELQGGTFSLAVDGDLFKAIVTLPQGN